jgi:hypothetical protein
MDRDAICARDVGKILYESTKFAISQNVVQSLHINQGQ